MATNIKYTAAERRSFELQPETCPTVDAAIDEAFKVPDLNDPVIARILKWGGLDASDKKVSRAIREVIQYALFPAKARLAAVVMHRATFPLRAALVDQVRLNMLEAGAWSEDRNHFTEWVDSWERMEVIRAERLAGERKIPSETKG